MRISVTGGGRYNAQVLMKLGDFSYSLYLNYLPVLMIVYAVTTLILGEFVFYNRLIYYLGSVLAIIFALFAYFLAEKPAIKYIQHRKSLKK